MEDRQLCRDAGGDDGPGPGGAPDRELPPDGTDAVGHAYEAAALGVCGHEAEAVIAYGEGELALCVGNPDAYLVRLRMLEGVGGCLGHDVVGGRLHLRVEPGRPDRGVGVEDDGDVETVDPR